jgi:hypothetical protein
LTAAVTSIDFVGAGITANVTGSNVTVTVTATGTGGGVTGTATPSLNLSFTGNGTATTYALGESLAATDLLVTVDTVIQNTPTNYTVSGQNLVFAAAPSSGSAIRVRTFGNYSSRDGFVDAFTANGTANLFTLSGNTLSSYSTIVFVDGVYQIPGTDFTTNGAQLVFASAPDANAEVVAQSFNNTIGDSIVANPPAVSVTTAVTTIDSFAVTNYRTAKYVVQASTATEFQSTEAMIVHDGSVSQLVTYATIYTGAAALVQFSANIVSNVVYFYANAVSSTASVKLQRNYVKV